MAGHAFIENKGKYLVTRRSKSASYMPSKWDTPGGVVEPGESLEEAIYREVKEETNLTIRIENILYIFSNLDQVPIRQTFQALYACTYLRGEVKLNLSEHDEYRWLPFDDIKHLDIITFLREFLDYRSGKKY